MTDIDRTAATSRSLASTPTTDFVVLVARVMIGLIFVLSGGPKLMNPHAAVASIANRGVPVFIAYLGPPVEFFGGLAIVFGVMTQAAAILMFVFTIVATITSHRYWQFTDPAQYRAQNTNFWKNVSIMGGMLLLFVTAGGRYSVDALVRRNR